MGKIETAVKSISHTLRKNSPHILTAMGCAGVVSTAVMAAKATPKTLLILEDEERWRKRNKIVPMTTTDKVKLTWKNYIPTAVVGTASIACIIGANTVNTKRNAALAALYTMSETAFRDYKTKVVEQIGQAKETKIRDEISKDIIHADPLSDNKPVIITGKGDVLCYEKMCGRYFMSSYETIRRIANDLNYRLLSDMWMDLNELYYELGLPSTELGYQVGFDIEKGKIEIDFSTQLDTTGQPCLVIDTNVKPKYVD